MRRYKQAILGRPAHLIMAPAPANTKDRFLDGVVPGNSEGKERDVLSIKDFARGNNKSASNLIAQIGLTSARV